MRILTRAPVKQFINNILAWLVAVGCAVLIVGCASTKPDRIQSVPSHPKVLADRGSAHPRLPLAGSGLGAYYQDDGPSLRPLPHLELVPDAVFKDEPYAKIGNRPYVVFGQKYTPLQLDAPYSEQGVASWYGVKFHGRRTSSGEKYDMFKMTAAHPTLPIPSYVRVTSLENGRQVVVRINDRGPFLSGRLIDVSYTAALKLGLLKSGRQRVRLDRILAADGGKAGGPDEQLALQDAALLAPR